MKKLVTVICVICGLFLFSSTAYADSPLTSTEFSLAYQDVPIVKETAGKKEMTSSIANYLKDSSNPIDKKAAVINALSWSAGGKSNADAYSKLIYKKPLSKLKVSGLSGDQQFCIGYLMAMDDYFDTKDALSYLKMAEKKITSSFTVSIIRALVDAMDTEGDSWKGCILPVWENSKLKMDMRQDAVDIILDYMAAYNESNKMITDKNNLIIKNGESAIVSLFGSYSVYDTPVEVTKLSDHASAAIYKDQYGIFRLKITGIKNGTSSIQMSDPDGKTLTVSFRVVSQNTCDKLSHTTVMSVSGKDMIIKTEPAVLDKNSVPFSKNNVTYLSLNSAAQVIGSSLKQNSKSGSYELTCNKKRIIFKPGSNSISIDGSAKKLKYKIITKNKLPFLSVHDFAAIAGMNYLDANGLILIYDKKISFDAISDDYIINELTTLVHGKSSSTNSLTTFTRNDLYGFQDANGKTVIEPVYSWAYNFANGLAPVCFNDTYYFIDGTGNKAFPAEFAGAGSFASGLAPVFSREDGAWGYVNTSGKLVIPFQYIDCSIFSEGYAAVKINDKWGYIDTAGKLVIPPAYDTAQDFNGGLATVTSGDYIYDINLFEQLVLVHENGHIYVGEIKDGLTNGKGVYTWPDASQYVGEFLDGAMEGRGRMTSPYGDTYEGNFSQNKFIATDPE